MGDARRTLLYATDFEPGARAAVPQVEALARALGWDVHLLHVRASRIEAFLSSGLASREAEDRLDAVARRIGSLGVATTTQVVAREDVDVAVARAASAVGASMVVIGAGSAPGQLLDRSAGRRILRAVSQPVWIARGEALPRKVLCGVDTSEESAHAARLSAELARALGASLAIASAVELPALNPTGLADGELEHDEAGHRAAREREIVDFVERSGVGNVGVVCRWGTPDGVLVSMATDDGYDLIVLGRRHDRDLRTFVVGGTAQRVIARAPCSVVVVGEGRGH